MASEDMFGSSDEIVLPGKGNEIKWRLVTNHQNLMYMLSAGMIMPPSGFGKKYYKDTLSLVPGWVPLFPENLWQAAVEHSVSEQTLLRPCYVEVDLAGVTGGVKVLRPGGWEDALFPHEVYGNEEMILVPAPLPITMVKEIVFSSKDDKSYCEKDAQNFSNVPLADFKTKAAATPFKRAKGGSWPPPVEGVRERQVDLTLPDAFGGVVTILSRLSNRNDAAVELTREFFRETPADEVLKVFPMLLGAHNLFYPSDMLSDRRDSSSVLYGGFTESLIRARKGADSISPKDIVMEALEDSNADLQGPARMAGDRLLEDLKRIVQFPDKTLEELMEAYNKPLPRSLIIFLINDRSLDLFDVDSTRVNGYDLCGAAILFGIAEGWMRMPITLRGSNSLGDIVPAYMAHLSHRLSGSNLELGALPGRPRSLRELFSYKIFERKENNAALYIARACKWNCIKTCIKLGKGDYQLLIDGSGASLVLDGDVKAVEAEVDQEKFMALLSGESGIPEKVENEARKMLEK